MNDNWITQPYIFDWLQSQLPFEMVLDLAATAENTKCESFITKEQNALNMDWLSTLEEILDDKNSFGEKEFDSQLKYYGCFCNPPYSRPNLWNFTEKALFEAMAGLNQCFLVPLDITKWSREHVWGKAEVWIPDTRIAFIDPDTGKPQTRPPKGSMIVIYGPAARKGLIKGMRN
jgi:phage N-6-adenine-methyltransferase